MALTIAVVVAAIILVILELLMSKPNLVNDTNRLANAAERIATALEKLDPIADKISAAADKSVDINTTLLALGVLAKTISDSLVKLADGFQPPPEPPVVGIDVKPGEPSTR